MMQLFFEPVDVWLFRDGRPFDRGSDHRARSIFPPYPSVIQGVIRSHHLVVQGVDLRDKQAIEDAVGTAADYRDLKMRGPFIARCDHASGEFTRYYPVPADAAPWSNETLRAVSRKDARQEDVVTSLSTEEFPLLLWPHDREPDKKRHGDWLEEGQLRKCLEGEAVTPISEDKLFVRESRFGIQLDADRRSTVEGALYEVDYTRPCAGVGLYVEVEGYDGWPAAGFTRLGGEGHGANFEQIKHPDWRETFPLPDPFPRRFKVYFASPAYFCHGWRPESWGQFFTGDVTLKAAAIHRNETIGGFDWAKGVQKTAQRYVPAGSVYYFESPGPVGLVPGLTQNAITQSGAEIGFGQVWITNW